MSSQRNNGNKHSKNNVNGYLSKSHSTGSQLGSQRLSGGLVSLGVTKRTRSTGLGTSGKLAVPKPVNLPSLKKEHSGNDPTTQIVPPGGGGGWNKPEEQSAANHSDSRQTSLTAGSTWGSAFHRCSPAPWDSGDKLGLGDREQFTRADRHLNPADYPTLEASVKSTNQGQARQTSVTPPGTSFQGVNKWEEDERVPVGATARAYSADWSERFEEDERSVFRREQTSGRAGWDDLPRERYSREWRAGDDVPVRQHREREGYSGGRAVDDFDSYLGRDYVNDRGSAGPPSRNSNYENGPRSLGPGRRGDHLPGRDSRGYGYDRYGDRYRGFEPEPRYVDDPTLFPPPPPPRAADLAAPHESRAQESFRDLEREAYDAELERVVANLEKDKTKRKEVEEPSPQPSEPVELVQSDHEEEVFEAPVEDATEKPEVAQAQEFGKLKAAESLQAILEAQEEEERKRKAAALEKLRELEARIAARAAEKERSQLEQAEPEDKPNEDVSASLEETSQVGRSEVEEEGQPELSDAGTESADEGKQGTVGVLVEAKNDIDHVEEDILSLQSSNVCVVGDGETIRSVLTDFADEDEVEDDAGEAVVSQLLNDSDEEQRAVNEPHSPWSPTVLLANGTQSAWQSGPPVLGENPDLFGTASTAFGPALISPTAQTSAATGLHPQIPCSPKREVAEPATTSPPSWRRVVQGSLSEPQTAEESAAPQDYVEPSSRSSSRSGKGRGKARNSKEPVAGGRGRGRGRTGRGGRESRSNARDSDKAELEKDAKKDTVEPAEAADVAEPGFIEVKSKKQLRVKPEVAPAKDAAFKGKPKGKTPVSRPQLSSGQAPKPQPPATPPVAVPPAAMDIPVGDAPVSSPYAFGTNLAKEVASIAKLQRNAPPSASRTTSNVLTSLDPVARPPQPPAQAEPKLEHISSPSLDRQVARPDTVDVLGVLPADLYLDTPGPAVQTQHTPASNAGMTFGYPPPAQGMQGLAHAPFPNMLFSGGPASMWQPPHQASRQNVPQVDSFYAGGPPAFSNTTFGSMNTGVLGDNRSVLSGPPLMFGQIGQFGKPNNYTSSMQGLPPLQFGQLGTAFGQPFVQTNKQPDWSMVPSHMPTSSQANARNSFGMAGGMEPMMPMSFPHPAAEMHGYAVGMQSNPQHAQLGAGPPMVPFHPPAAPAGPSKPIESMPNQGDASGLVAQTSKASSMTAVLPDEVFINENDGTPRMANGQPAKKDGSRRQPQGGQMRPNNANRSGRAARARRPEQEQRPASHASGGAANSNSKAGNRNERGVRGRTQPMKTIYVPKAEGVGTGRNGPDATAAV